MPLMRRRPLARAALVGGGAYALGKRSQRKSEHEDEQDAQIQQEQQPQAAPAPAAPAPMSESERIDALTKLKDLHDSGVLTEEQFESEKSKLLQEG
jgi:hypothetical protein